MKIVSRLKKEESGQALIVVTIVLLLGAIVIPPMLSVNFAGTRSTQIHENRMLELYAADYGVEDALYQIQSELDGIASLTFESAPYLTQTPSVNESELDVTVEKVWLPEDLPAGYPLPVGAADKSDKLVMVGMVETSIVEACWDDFETGGMAGGDGWLDPWTSGGHCSVWESSAAPQGDYHLECRGDLFTWGYVERSADLSGIEQARLQFQAKAGNFKPGDMYVCKVDPGGGNWTEVRRWEFGAANDTYSSYDIDLSGFPMTNDFAVRLEGNLTNGNSAIDTFEIGGSSGTWIGSWQGAHDITGAGSPYEGSRHLRIRGSNDEAWREVDLTGYGKPTLQFQAKVSSFESADRAYLDVFDGSAWHNAVREWSESDDEGNYNPYEVDLSDYPYVGPGDYTIRFRDGMNSNWDYFYVDDLRIVDYSYFCVDDLTIGEEGNVYKVEIAYTDAAVGAAFMDRFGVWLPAGFEYVDVIEVNGMPDRDPDVITANYKGGTALEWDYSGSLVNLNPGGQLPIVRDITFTFKPSSEPKGVFCWLRTQEGYESWDRSCEIYKATSVASHEASGTSTRVEAYVAQGELNREAIVSYGNYMATGGPLLIDQDKDFNETKEYRLDPTAGSPTWWYDPVDEIWYTGRGTINTAPEDGEVIAAWLYWAAFVDDGDWIGPDETVELLHPKRYYGEALGVALDGDGNNVFLTDNSPVTVLPREETVYITPKRYRGEYLGMASANVTSEEFWVNRTPIVTAPRAEYVYRNGSNLLTKDVDYAINYTLGNVTIINPALSGNITIDYSAAGYDYPVQGVGYTIDYPSGQIMITNDELVGNVYVDYCAETWTTVNHEAYNKYGMSLDPVVETGVPGGNSYACFSDVTDILEGTGNGVYAVRGVQSSEAGSSGQPLKCFSGWSLVVLYESPSETAHQLFIYDPIHNSGDCAFHVPYPSDQDFTLTNFYPPDGVVEGKLTYFVGEGDGSSSFEGDYIQIKGASESTYKTLEDPPANPDNNAMNSVSTHGERGVDIDEFNIMEGDINIGDDTEADVRCHTTTDRWYLIYMILSFKTEGVPKEEYSFTVGTLTYTYEVETGG